MPRTTKPARGLAAEIQQGKPFPGPEVEAYLNLLRTVDLLSGEVSALCKTEGISQPQYNVLRILRGAGAEGLPCGDVAERMIHRLPDISRLLDRLEKARLIRKKRDADDGRIVRVVIAAKGLRTLERLDAPLLDLHRRQFSGLGQDELDRLNQVLEELRASAG